MAEENFNFEKGGFPLSDGWSRFSSKNKPGKYFYFNKTTGEKSWTNPFKDTKINDNDRSSNPVKRKHSLLNEMGQPQKTTQEPRLSPTKRNRKLSISQEKVKLGKISKKNAEKQKSPLKKAIQKRIAGKNNNQSHSTKQETLTSVVNASNEKNTSPPLKKNLNTSINLRKEYEEVPNKKRKSANERLSSLREELAKCINNLPSTSSTSFERDKNDDNDMVCEPIETSISGLSTSYDEILNGEQDCVYFVLDTNILMEDLNIVTEISSRNEFAIAIPWRVVLELDGLKENKKKSSTSYKARQAIDFLFKSIPNTSKIKVQSLREFNDHIYKCESSDDEILNCVLQNIKKGHNMILVTSDKNLHVKASSNSVKCMTVEEFRKIGKVTAPQPASHVDNDIELIYKNWSQHLLKLLSTILENEMRARYDNLWTKIVYKPSPWSLKDCLECIHKHWMGVFSEVLLRNETTVKQMLNITEELDKSVTQTGLEQFRLHTTTLVTICQIIPEYQRLAVDVMRELSASVQPDLPDKDVIGTLEKVWIYLSSYGAKVANSFGIQHDLEDVVYQNSNDVIEFKFLEKYTQLFSMSFSLKRYLKASDETTKAKHSETVWKTINAVLLSEGCDDLLNKNKYDIFITTQKNLLVHMSEKLNLLEELLHLCKVYLVKNL